MSKYENCQRFCMAASMRAVVLSAPGPVENLQIPGTRRPAKPDVAAGVTLVVVRDRAAPFRHNARLWPWQRTGRLAHD